VVNKEQTLLSLSEQYYCQSGKRGSVLILTLWVIFMLAILAVAVGAHIDGRLALARRVEERTVGYLAARVGVERGIARLLQETNSWDCAGEPWSDCPAEFSNVVSGAGVYSVMHVELQADGRSNTVYGLRDEQAKINLNLPARIELITALLEVAGGVSPEEAARIGESINLARTPLVEKFPAIGGKTGWVNPEIVPGPFRSIDELRWVKGVTPELLANIRAYVTVCGGNRVNLNTADAVVLQCVGLRAGGGGAKGAQSLARKILKFRERGGIFKTYLGAGLAEAMGEDARLTSDEQRMLNGMTPYVTVVSDYFGGYVEGGLAVGAVSQPRRIEFVWARKERKFEYWHED
jgi:hypothetical protein